MKLRYYYTINYVRMLRQNTSANKEGTKKAEIAVPLKHLSNFWKTLDIPLVNCEVSLALS